LERKTGSLPQASLAELTTTFLKAFKELIEKAGSNSILHNN